MQDTAPASVVRCRHDILRDILELLNAGPRPKTQVAGACNLNTLMLKEYMAALLLQRWIRLADNLIHITPEGRTALRSLVNLKEVAA